jgi:hypothetical protein
MRHERPPSKAAFFFCRYLWFDLQLWAAEIGEGSLRYVLA